MKHDNDHHQDQHNDAMTTIMNQHVNSRMVLTRTLQVLRAHDYVSPFAHLLPSLSARTTCSLGRGEISREPVLFIPPSHFSRLFTAIESDFVALTTGIKDGPVNSSVGTAAGANCNDNGASPLNELKRLTLKSKRFGFHMVMLLVSLSTGSHVLQADMFYFGLCIGCIVPLAT